MNELVSVVIPTFNREQVVCNAIDSVLKQTYNQIELIIIDDGSTDNTPNIIKKKYPDAIYYYQNNKGVSAARNKGIEMSKGSYISFLDSDDRWSKKKIEKQMKILNETDYSVCYTNEIWIKNGKRINQKKRHKKYSGDIFKFTLPLCIISPSSILLEKNIFTRIGSFDEDFIVCEDYELWLRLTLTNKIYFLDENLITKYGGHPDQLSTRYWGMDRYRINALLKLLENDIPEKRFYLKQNHKNKFKFTLNKSYRREVIKELLKKCRIYIAGAKKRNKTKEIGYYEEIIQYYSEKIKIS